MNLLHFFRPNTYFWSPEALQNPHKVRKLHLWVDEDMTSWYSKLPLFNNLDSLCLQGDASIFNCTDLVLPPTLGEYVQLKELTLCNIPYQCFPDWIKSLQISHQK